MVEPRRSWGPMLECLRMGRPPPGVPPGLDAQLGAIRILGVIRVLSESRRLGKAFWTRRKLLSGEEGEAPNHQPPSTPESVKQPVKHIDATPGTSHAISRGISHSISIGLPVTVTVSMLSVQIVETQKYTLMLNTEHGRLRTTTHSDTLLPLIPSLAVGLQYTN